MYDFFREIFEAGEFRKDAWMARFLPQLVTFGLLGSALIVPQHAAVAASPCDGVDTKLTAQRKSDYADLVAKSLDQNIRPSKVSIQGFMQSETWSVVYAEVSVADPGYFFFDSSTGRPVFKDVWGGMADEGDGPQITRWAKKLGANNAIASCFADTVTK